MAGTRLVLCALVVITNICLGLTMHINNNEESYHNSNLLNQNIVSKTLSSQNGINQNIKNQSEHYIDTSYKNVTSSSIGEIKTNTSEEESLKYKTLKEALHGLQGWSEDEGESWQCSTCYYIARMVSTYVYYGGGMANGTMESTLHNICSMVVDYDPDTFCTGIVTQQQSLLEVEWIYQHRYVRPEETCTQFLGSRGCKDFRGGEWWVDLPPVKNRNATLSTQDMLIENSTNLPNTEMINSNLNNRDEKDIEQTEEYKDSIKDVKDNKNSSQFVKKRALKVLHLTDPHYDPHYKIGSNAACHAPLCCNEDSGEAVDPSAAAGKWGDYRHCDSPKWLLENMYQHILDNHPDIDYIMNTGDLVPHHIWKANQQDNLDIINDSSEMMLHYFPNIPIYSTIGNHESFPVNSFPAPETDAWSSFNVQWLYDALSEQWSRLMHQEVPGTAKYAGYYSVIVRPGFRIISINTNYCYRFNWWLLYKSEDPGDVLKWLVKELESAEAADEKVHIIGHTSPLSRDCFQQWAHQFSRIISRFSKIIKGQFYGHTHFDEFRLHYDVDDTDIPVGVEYITPNNGPFKFLNPAFRIFYVDGEHENSFRDVLDYETWVMNLTHANLYDDPHWYHLYSAREDLNMETLLPNDWNKLVHRMAEDKQLFDKYFRFRIQDSDAELELGCDEYCQREILCKTVDGNKLIPNKC